MQMHSSMQFQMRYLLINTIIVITLSAIIGASLCVNNRDYRFGGNMKQSCSWIRNNEDQRQEYCSLYADVGAACPQACGLCCEDDLEYRFQTEKGGLKSCAWLAESSGRA